MLSLIDNREVSPAPVSRFAPKTLGYSNNIAHNRITLPFNRAGSFNVTSKPGLDKVLTGGLAARNFKFAKADNPSVVSLQQLINSHTTGITGILGTNLS